MLTAGGLRNQTPIGRTGWAEMIAWSGSYAALIFCRRGVAILGKEEAVGDVTLAVTNEDHFPLAPAREQLHIKL